MAGPGERVLLDANVYVAAVRHPSRQTATFRLLVRLLTAEDLRLIGNDLLATEYLRYAEVFPSPTASALAAALVTRMELVRVEDRFVLACLPYFPPDARADCVHAATCLQTGALLVSNDRHFQRIREEGLVQVLPISEAIRRWLP